MLKNKNKKDNKFAPNEPKPNISFSFQHINTGSEYGTDYFDKNIAVAGAFLKRLRELSAFDCVALNNMPKIQGYETIPSVQLKAGVLRHLSTSQIPTKVTVFRFNNQKCRIIGTLTNHILYIYAFDFNNNAYNH